VIVSDLWICKHADKCTGISDWNGRMCNYKFTFIIGHVRYRHKNSKANWYRIGCHCEDYQDEYGQAIAVRWKG
jgi:hypothetical protein